VRRMPLEDMFLRSEVIAYATLLTRSFCTNSQGESNKQVVRPNSLKSSLDQLSEAEKYILRVIAKTHYASRTTLESIPSIDLNPSKHKRSFREFWGVGMQIELNELFDICEETGQLVESAWYGILVSAYMFSK